MLLRDERVDDTGAVDVLHREAFGGEHGGTVAALVTALRRDDPDALAIVADEDGVVVGHVMVTRTLFGAPAWLVGLRDPA